MKYLIYSIIAGFSLVFAACGNEATAPETPAAATAHEATEAGTVALTTAQIKTAGITFEPAAVRQTTDVLPVTGEWKLHNESIALASATTFGVITDLRTGLNKPVRKGEVVAMLRNPDLIDLQQQYLENKTRLVFLNAEYERYKALQADNATALKQFQKTESELRTAQTTAAALAGKLNLIGVNPDALGPENLRSEIAITAPVSGVITRTLANLGASVTAGTAICEITDLASGHADFYVFQKDLHRVRTGQKVTLSAGQPTTLSGQILSIDPSVDPAKGTTVVHVRVLSDARQYTPPNGAYLNGVIKLSSNSIQAPSLPESAVVQEKDGPCVFQLLAETAGQSTFQKIPVLTRPAGAGWLAIEPKSGTLTPNARYIIHGVYYVAAQAEGIEVEE